MTDFERLMRKSNRDILVNACVGFERYINDFGRIPNSVLDMGAHIGGLTLKAMEKGVPFIVAIEADRDNYLNLVENVKRQIARINYQGHIECLHRAFCDSNNEIVDLVKLGNGIANSAQRSMFYSSDAEKVKYKYIVEKVWSIDIDEIINRFKSYGVFQIDLFKCDIEGAEFIAMPMNEKTRGFLSRVKYIDFELHPWTNKNYYDSESFFDRHKEFNKDERIVTQYFKFLQTCGFHIPDEMINSNEHDYLKLTTYNKYSYCVHNRKEVSDYALCI